MSEQTNEGRKGAVLVLGGCFTTVAAVIFLLVITSVLFIDTTNCGSVSRGLPVLWGLTALVFFISVIVVRLIAWRILGSNTGRWVSVVIYAVLMLVNFVFIAFAILVLFNC